MALPRKKLLVVSMVLTVVLASLATLLALMRNAAMYDANTQMKYLMVALHQYASEYGDGHLPPQNGHRGLLALYSLGILGQNDTSLLLDPRKWPRGSWSELPESDVAYWYVGVTAWGSRATALCSCRRRGGHGAMWGTWTGAFCMRVGSAGRRSGAAR
jgi:hypothetical protein